MRTEHFCTIACVAVVALPWVLSSGAVAQDADRLAPRVIPRQPYLAYDAVDSLGRTIQFYLSEPTGSALPLLVFVQGSGATSLFRRTADGWVAGAMGHSTVHDVFSATARILLVEKPGVSYLDTTRSVADADPQFHREHTLDRWALAVRRALRAACASTDIDCTRGVVIVGHSEGGVAAARVAATSDLVTHVAILAGEGATQLFSLLTLARAGEFFKDHGSNPGEREAYLLSEWRRILAAPGAHDRFFFGHPYRRWSSFLSSSPASELLKSRAKVFVAQGTRDSAVAPASADVLFATLAAQGRDVCYLRMEGADHSFSIPGGNGWRLVLEQVRDWLLDAAPEPRPWLCRN